MCLEIKNSAVAKSPEFFFGALKMDEIKKYIFQEIVIQEISVQLFENVQNLKHFKFDLAKIFEWFAYGTALE